MRLENAPMLLNYYNTRYDGDPNNTVTVDFCGAPVGTWYLQETGRLWWHKQHGKWVMDNSSLARARTRALHTLTSDPMSRPQTTTLVSLPKATLLKITGRSFVRSFWQTFRQIFLIRSFCQTFRQIFRKLFRLKNSQN